MKLADQLKNRKIVIEEQEKHLDAARMAVLEAKWDTAVKIATGDEMRQKLFDEVEKLKNLNYFNFAVMDSRTVPNCKGGSSYDIPLNGSGNMYCAIRDGKVSQKTLFEWYPPFQTVRDFYEKEGFKVEIREDSDGGMNSWLSLVISFEKG